MSLSALFSRIPASLTDRLGCCALQFLWQGAAIGAGLWLLLRICRRGTAELRHTLCGMALLLMAVAPVITWQRLPVPASKVRTVALPAAVAVADSPDPAALLALENLDLERRAGSFPGLPISSSQEPFAENEDFLATAKVTPDPAIHSLWPRWLGSLWLAGAGLMGLWRLCALGGTFRLIRRSERAAGELLDRVARMARNCGLRRVPGVRITRRLISPAVAGVLRPVLLLPASALAGLSPRELDFVLAHEFAHIRRQDFLLGLLQSLAETLLFFHPAVWWVSRRMSFEREQACDDAAMRITGNRRAGASALARLAELQLQHTTAMAPAAGGGEILARVRRLLEPARPPQRGQFLVLLPVLLTAAVVPLLLTQRAESQTPANPSGTPAMPGSTPEEPANPVLPSQAATSFPSIQSAFTDKDSITTTAIPENVVPAMRGSITDRNGVVFAESTIRNSPGAGVLQTVETRHYPLGASASHVLGYVRQIPNEDLKNPQVMAINSRFEESRRQEVEMRRNLTRLLANQKLLSKLSGERLIERVLTDEAKDEVLTRTASQWRKHRTEYENKTSDGFSPEHPEMVELASAINKEEAVLMKAVENHKMALESSVKDLKEVLLKMERVQKDMKAEYARSGGLTGVEGMEKMLDDTLRATASLEGKAQPAVALTLDARIQRICENALRDAHIGRGAAVVLDVNNGDILAMASVPDFDPNQLVPVISKENWSALSKDPTIPLVNRAMSGFPPGSVFKLVTAIAAGESGTWKRSFTCSGSVDYGGRPFSCWTVKQHLESHGTLDLADALKNSCNCWFYQAGNAAGIDAIAATAAKLGMGTPTDSGLNPGYDSGFIPSREWWAGQKSGPWTEAKTANVAIGQGEVLATPLQMAAVAAAVANDGKVWQQHIISKSLVNGVWQSPAAELRHDLIAEGTPAADLAAIREGMWKTVNDNAGATGNAARSTLIRIAGKTGTAQKWRTLPDADGITRDGKKIPDNHTWFIGFAPYEKPRYAFAILVGNGKSGGSVSAPVAKQIMESVELMNRGKLNVDLSPLTVAKGNFNFVESVKYRNPPPAE